jgi:hypothetical protein
MRLSSTFQRAFFAATLAATLIAATLLAVRWHEQEIARARFDAGYQIGIAEANLDLYRGTAHRYVMGDRPIHQDTDPDSGLPITAIAGCVVTRGDIGRAAGYNDTVDAWRARHATVKGSDIPVSP